MTVPFITVDQLRNAVHIEDLVEPVSRAFQDFSAGLASSDLLVMYPGARADLGDVYVKTGSIRGHRAFIVKVSPWFAQNVERGRPQGGFIGVFDAETGDTLALLGEEHYLSDIRTAAAGALAARVLAPPRVDVVTVAGTGVQAFWQPLALYCERPFEELLVWGRDAYKAQRLVERLQPALDRVRITVSEDLERSVRRSDVIITTTSAKEPFIRGAWLRPGQHVTAIGADDSTKCELDAACLERADLLVVDSIASAELHGNVHRHLCSGAITRERIHGEIGRILAGKLEGRTAQQQLSVATFIGLGVQDLAAATVSLEKLGVGARN